MQQSLRWKPFLFVLAAGFALGAIAVVSSRPFVCSLTPKVAGGNTSRNNLRTIATALFNYELVTGSLPRDIVGPDGEPLLSWRVSLLPHLDEQALHKRFRFDERWDSPHNLPLARELTDFFNPYGTRNYVGDPHDAVYATAYVAVRGPGTVWNEDRYRLQAPGDDLCLLAVEMIDSGIVWTEPRDLDVRTIEWAVNLPDRLCIRGAYSDEFNIALSDIATRLIKAEDVTPEFLGDLAYVRGSAQRPDKRSPQWQKLFAEKP